MQVTNTINIALYIIILYKEHLHFSEGYLSHLSHLNTLNGKCYLQCFINTINYTVHVDPGNDIKAKKQISCSNFEVPNECNY